MVILLWCHCINNILFLIFHYFSHSDTVNMLAYHVKNVAEFMLVASEMLSLCN